MTSSALGAPTNDKAIVTNLPKNPALLPLCVLGFVFTIQSVLTLMQGGQLTSYMIGSHVLMLAYGLAALWLAFVQFSPSRRGITIGWGVSAVALFGIAVAIEIHPHSAMSVATICLVFLLLSMVPVIAASRRLPVHG